VIDLGHGLDNIQDPSFMFVMVVGQAWLSIVLMGGFQSYEKHDAFANYNRFDPK